MNKIAIYPGTFDPITLGHVDVIERASTMFDKIIIVVAVNSKKLTLFSEEERSDMVKQALKHNDKVSVDIFSGLVCDYTAEKQAVAIIRGVRALTDFEFEFQIALMNRKLHAKVNTIFMMPHEKYTYLNSSIIRELSSFGQDVSEFVPEYVARKLLEKYNINK